MIINRRNALGVILGSAALVLSGCSTLAPKTTTQQTHYSGRFSGRFERAGKTETLTGRYRLTVSAEETVLDLLTPLYGVIGRITVTSTGAVLEKGGEIVAREASAEVLMNNTLGFALPLAMLQSWLEGRPHTATAFERIDEKTFEQSGWRIRTTRVKPDGTPAAVAVTALRYPYLGSSLTLTVDKE